MYNNSFQFDLLAMCKMRRNTIIRIQTCLFHQWFIYYTVLSIIDMDFIYLFCIFLICVSYTSTLSLNVPIFKLILSGI